jgi:hypothetical protein
MRNVTVGTKVVILVVCNRRAGYALAGKLYRVVAVATYGVYVQDAFLGGRELVPEEPCHYLNNVEYTKWNK